MSLRVNTNVTAMTAHGNLVTNDSRLSTSIEKLSSGLRINRAADDAAGLTISEKLKTQIRGIARAQLNVQDGQSLIQTAEGALNETHSMLQRMRELCIQSANDTLTTTDRLEIQKEIAQLKEDINRIANDTEYNTKKLLDGTGTAAISTSDPANLTGLACGTVLTFSDFSVTVMVKQEVIPGIGYKSYDGVAEVQRSAIFTDLDGNIASSSTTLQSISNFYDAEGNFILDLPQTLYLQGDNSQGVCTVSKDLTLAQLTERIQAMATADQLDKGLHFEGSTAKLELSGDNNGQITVVSGRTGEIGRINFTGEESLVKALGFEDVIKAEDPVYSVAVTNLGVPYGARKTLTTQVAGNRASGLIEGIDLYYEPPQSARVDTGESYVGVTVPADITFDINDSLDPAFGGLADPGVTVTVPAGDYSMEQVAEIINGQILAAYPTPEDALIRCSINDHYAIQFNSVNTGSAGWISIENAADNVLGVTNGTYHGTGGGSASYTADLANNGLIQDFDYAATNVNFTLADMHGNTATVSLTQDYTNLTTQDIANEINNQVGANSTPSSMSVRAEVINGVLSFRSTETGYNSGFDLTDGGNLAKLQMSAGSFRGVDGNVANQDFAYTQSATAYGFNVAGTSPQDDLVFTIADLDGTAMQVTIPAEDAGYTLNTDGTLATGPTAGDSFVPATEIVAKINEAANAKGCKVHAEFDTLSKRIKLVSDVTGKEGKIVITDNSEPASINNLRSVFDIDQATYQNGIGQTAYTMHVKDTSITLQIGPNEGATCTCNIVRCDIRALGIEDLDLTTAESANRAIGIVDHALQIVSSERAKLGAIENRLTYTSNSLAVASENMTNAQSRIADVDMAAEVIEMTQAQILQQASNAMVAQANTSAQSVLQLLQ